MYFEFKLSIACRTKSHKIYGVTHHRQSKQYAMVVEFHDFNQKLAAYFGSWTSGNEKIDALIQKTQLQAERSRGYLEWIDPQRITDIKHIADGGFGSVYQATWKNAQFITDGWDERKVALKVTNSSINRFLNEVKMHIIFC
jgi:hypothetical protein